MTHTNPVARRMHQLIEPVHLVAYFAEDADHELRTLGMRNYWDGYFASRGGVLGASAPAEVVDAVFYNFGPGEVARHVPWVWGRTTPEQAIAAKTRGCARSLRSVLGDRDVARVGDLALQAATSAPVHGRALYAGYRAQPLPTDPVERLWWAATLLREHRGDGHNAVLVAEGVNGIEAHMLAGVEMGMQGEEFGRIHHMDPAFLAATKAGLVSRGVLDGEGRFTPAGRALKDRIEARTDALAEPPYAALSAAELDELVTLMTPINAALVASGIPAP